MHIELFESFEKKVKKKKKKQRGETGSYPPPEYLVQPAKNDTGFFMVKAAFDKQQEQFSPKISWGFSK